MVRNDGSVNYEIGAAYCSPTMQTQSGTGHSQFLQRFFYNNCSPI